MPSKKITEMPDWAGNQVSTDLVTGVDLSAALADQNVKSTLNDLFSIITKNITDGAVRFTGTFTPAISGANAGALYYNDSRDTFQGSRNASAYSDLLFGIGAVTQVAVWTSLTDQLQGYPEFLYVDASKRAFITSGSNTNVSLENSFTSATVPKAVKLLGGSGIASIYSFDTGNPTGGPVLNFCRGTTGPALPASGMNIGSIQFFPAASAADSPTVVGGATFQVRATQTAQVGVGGGVGVTITTAANNEINQTTRFLISQAGVVVIGANGQGITSTFGGSQTGVVIGTMTTYSALGAVQIANPFTGNDAVTVIIQANAGQTNGVFRLEKSDGSLLYLVGSSGTHTYGSITGVAVSPAGQGRIYYDSSSNKFQVSQNGAAYVDMIGGTVGGLTTNVQFNNAGSFGGSAAFSWDDTGKALTLGVASTTTGKLVLSVSGSANSSTIQAGDAPASSVVYKWPADNPAASDVLTVTSFGGGVAVLEWAPSGGGSSPPFDDATALVKGSADATKLLRIEVDGLTTGTTRVWTAADANIVVAGSASALSSGRVPYVTTAGLLLDSSTFLWNNATTTMTLGASGGSTAFLDLQGSSNSGAIRMQGGTHPGTGGGVILPFVGGSQSSGPGIWWGAGAYGSLAGFWISGGFNLQGWNSSNSALKIRKGTGTSSDGAVSFTLDPDLIAFTTVDAGNFVFGTTTGTKIGTATSQKIGFWNATPIIQPAAAAQAALTDSTGGTPSTTVNDVTGAFDQAILNNNFASILNLLGAMRTAMVSSGLMKGAA